MDDNSNKLLGFDAILDVFSSEGLNNNLSAANIDNNEISDEELENLKRNSKSPSVVEVFGKTNTKKITDDDDTAKIDKESEEDDDDDEDLKEELKDKKTDSKKKQNTEEEDKKSENTSDIDENDSEDENQISILFDAVTEELGLAFDEEEDIKKPETVEELVQYFKEIIEENSTPEYASEEVQELDEFVRNGGKLEDYFSVSAQIDYDNFDITEEQNQKTIIRELLLEKGFSEKQISRKLEKYEDAGLLEDEAEEALEVMKEIAENKKQKLLEEQKIEYQNRIERQQKFVDDVVDNIKSLDNIRGIAIPQKDKKALLNYIFKADADGLTQYQRDYSKSVKNLIESAYFTMKGDTLLDTAKQLGNNSAINRLKQSLKTQNTSKGGKRTQTNSSNSIWGSVVSKLSA